MIQKNIDKIKENHKVSKYFQIENNLNISSNLLLQFGYMFVSQKLDFNFDILKKELFDFENTNNQNKIYFQYNKNQGFIEFINFKDLHKIHKFFIFENNFAHFEKGNGFIINIFGEDENKLETLNFLRKNIEIWIKKNDFQFISLINNSNEITTISNCMRFFYYIDNINYVKTQNNQLIDFEKLLEYKSLEKNTYFADYDRKEIAVEDLLKYVGAENEKLFKQWNGSQYITNVEIKNFKIFSNIKTDISKHINILIGKNGLGKTSFLQAITLGLLPLTNVDKSNELEKFISLNFNKSEISISWDKECRKIYVFKNELKQESYLDLPQKLILAYGVNLNTSEKLSYDEIIENLLSGNARSYSTKSIFKDYSTDFYDPIIILEKLFLEKKGRQNKLIEDLILLIKNTLNKYLDLFSEPEKISLNGDFANYFYLDFNNNKIKTNNLSEGYKDFILQITDILIRILACRNIIFENKKNDLSENILQKIKGVILIDEFDRHLHPDLQRKFLIQLEKDFQNIQFILSTHNVFSLQSAEGFTALIIETEDNKLKISAKEIQKGLSIESIYKIYLGINSNYNIVIQEKLNIFRKYLDEIYNDILKEDDIKFIQICKELLDETLSQSVNNIVNRELAQLERLTSKKIIL